MAKNDRFQVIHSEGNGLTGPQLTVLMDTATGVQYLLAQSGYAGGCAPWWIKRAGPSSGKCKSFSRRPVRQLYRFCAAALLRRKSGDFPELPP